MDECVTLSPLGILGYGIPEKSLNNAISEYDIDVIASDAGSIDPGPNYLGLGKPFTDYEMVKRDVNLLLETRNELGVPLLIGTSGGSGAAPHLQWLDEIVRETLHEKGISATIARIFTDVEPKYLKHKRDNGEISRLDYDVELTDSRIADTTTMVGQVGHEPFVNALDNGADIVLGGRSTDLAPFTAIPRRKGFDPGLSAHLAKILECGAHATEAGTGADSLIGILRNDHFVVEPPNPNKQCTVESVAAHTLYEKADPNRIHMPDGAVDVRPAEFEQVGDRRVKVSGSLFEPSEQISMLVEGVRLSGFRTITVAGIRDPTTMDNLEELIEHTTNRVDDYIDDSADQYKLSFRKYGENAVPLTEVNVKKSAPEVGIIIDVLADTQVLADTICSMARSTLLHQPFEGRTATGGNLAFPYSPSDISVGEVYEFSVHHLIENVDPLQFASQELEVIE